MKYLWVIIKHKCFVLLAGIKIGAPLWRLIIHDWTKLLPCEFPHYSRRFCGDALDPDGFTRAMVRHQNSNPHHWEHWVINSGVIGHVLSMPDWAIREMAADWIAACRAYEGHWPTKGDWPWFRTNFDRLILHPDTRHRVTMELVVGGYLEVSV